MKENLENEFPNRTTSSTTDTTCDVTKQQGSQGTIVPKVCLKWFQWLQTVRQRTFRALKDDLKPVSVKKMMQIIGMNGLHPYHI